MYEMFDVCDDALPRTKPRYLMGVGFPEDLIEGVARGVDLFDCVAPTRMGRNNAAFTSSGRLNLKNADHKTDERPIDEECGCLTCQRYHRAYLRHLFNIGEPSALRLATIHNLHFLSDLMQKSRVAIEAGTFGKFVEQFRSRFVSHGGQEIA